MAKKSGSRGKDGTAASTKVGSARSPHKIWYTRHSKDTMFDMCKAVAVLVAAVIATVFMRHQGGGL